MIKDKLFKRLLIPVLGILIPFASGLIDLSQLKPVSILFSIVFFIFISHLVWKGSVTIFSFLRTLKALRDNIFSKLVVLSMATSFYGTFTVFIASALWQLTAFKLINTTPIVTACIITCGAVTILTLIYEALFLHAEVSLDAKVMQQLNEERLWAEASVLQKELEPHFLFNCLNTLSYLVQQDPSKAYQFVLKLSNVLKYLLLNKQKELVALSEEIHFLDDYYFLLRVRFDDSVCIENSIPISLLNTKVLPCTLQVLVENVIKHNFFSEREPMVISIQMSNSHIIVSNTIKPKHFRPESTKIGLHNLKIRYQLILNKEVLVHTVNNKFSVKVPFLT